MLDKVKGIEEHYTELERQLSDPATMANNREFARLAKERSQLQEVVECIREYRRVQSELADYKAALESNDEDLRELAKEELPGLRENLASLETRLKQLMTPRDLNDDKDVILEIRAGTGGEEASLFAADLFRMYTRYAEVHGWKVEVLSMSNPGLGGIRRSAITSISGKRRHTAGLRIRRRSASRAARIPPPRRRGASIPRRLSRVAASCLGSRRGRGQHQRGKRLAHRRDARLGSRRPRKALATGFLRSASAHPSLSGMVIICRDEKSQHKNKARALKILRARLLEKAHEEQDAKIAESRRSMVGTGDRSERIRTYNFPQSRVTDHRINLTLHQLERVLDGGLDPLIDALSTQEQAQALGA